MNGMERVCKPYFVADVKRILPPKSETSAKNQRICRIIRLPTWYFILSARPGGINALTCPVRSQKRKLAPVCNAQPASRASQRYIVSASPILRPPRSTPGQIRDVTPGDQRGLPGWDKLCRLWFLADELFPIAQAVQSGRVVWLPSSGERSTPLTQAVYRGANLCRGYLASRTGPAHLRLTGACAGALRYFRPPAQHRASPGQSEKKTSSQQKLPRQTFTNGRSASECLFRYEIIRCQALEATELSGSQAFEMAFIERQGLAAWMAAGWSDLSDCGEKGIGNADNELVPALADLVLGDREEITHG